MPSIQWKLTSCGMVVMVAVMEKEGMMTGTVLDLFIRLTHLVLTDNTVRYFSIVIPIFHRRKLWHMEVK